MNNKEFISALSLQTGMSADLTQKMLQQTVGLMADSFVDGDTVQIPNFGTFEVKKKLERIMVNPTTGQRMLVPPKLVLNFKPNSAWKDQIKKGGKQ